MIGRLAYGAAFVVALPLLAVFWAQRLDASTSLPPVQSELGFVLAALGAALVVWSWLTLARDAGGLPMNAFPPPRFTRLGPYRIVNDPIYIGAVAVAAGLAIGFGSAAGFWIVTPLIAAGCVALVWGHERLDLTRRFGERPPALLQLAENRDRAPRLGERFWCWTHLLVPWLVLYEAIGHLPVPRSFEVWLAFERDAPVHVLAEIPYASVYIAVVLAPFFVLRADELRRLVRIGQVGCLLGFCIYLTLPAIAPPRPIEATGWLADMLRLERADGLAGRAALPSFHVFWSIWAAHAWWTRAGGMLGCVVSAAWASLAIAACWLTGMHAVVDLVGGVALYAIAANARRLWRMATLATERLANAWREWRLGSVRVINHGFFAGAAASGGLLVAHVLLPSGTALVIVAVALISLVSAALWGQALVGGRTLKRPFGYFGSIIGVGIAFAVAAAFGIQAPAPGLWGIAAAIATAAPVIQAIGRLRCMVQGCCHGAPCGDADGIRVSHPRSRVVFVSKLSGVPILPTPLISIAGNVVIFPLLLRLWWIEAPAALILGGYYILQGLARFVEEGHRGEVQTQKLGPFRVYQVLSAAMILAGIAVTCLPSPPVSWAPSLDGSEVLAATLVGVIHVFAMGVDFPESDRRFSRLV